MALTRNHQHISSFPKLRKEGHPNLCLSVDNRGALITPVRGFLAVAQHNGTGVFLSLAALKHSKLAPRQSCALRCLTLRQAGGCRPKAGSKLQLSSELWRTACHEYLKLGMLDLKLPVRDGPRGHKQPET